MDNKITYIDWEDNEGNMGTSFAIILEAESRAEAVKEYERIKSLNTPSAKTKGQTATQKPKKNQPTKNYDKNTNPKRSSVSRQQERRNPANGF